MYCSLNLEFTMASRNDRVPRSSVCQLGRGSEPMMVVGSVFPALAFNMIGSPVQLTFSICPDEAERTTDSVTAAP